jgi:hypothetical protein
MLRVRMRKIFFQQYLPIGDIAAMQKTESLFAISEAPPLWCSMPEAGAVHINRVIRLVEVQRTVVG